MAEAKNGGQKGFTTPSQGGEGFDAGTEDETDLEASIQILQFLLIAFAFQIFRNHSLV
jgi:hypothetical protein